MHYDQTLRHDYESFSWFYDHGCTQKRGITLKNGAFSFFFVIDENEIRLAICIIYIITLTNLEESKILNSSYEKAQFYCLREKLIMKTEYIPKYIHTYTT